METPILSPIQIRDERGRFVKGTPSLWKGTKGLRRNSLKGKAMPEEWKAKLRKPKSIKHIKSPEHRAKLSAAMKLRVGPLNSRWKGGFSAAKSARRRARLEANGGSHTNGEWETLKARYNWTCPACKKGEPEIKLTRDHIVSLMEGGSDNIENIQPLCMRCNVKKRTNTIKYG